MTVPPLPDVPCIRVRMTSAIDAVSQGGVRFYLSYAGSAPTGANCATIAGDVASAWASHLAAVTNADSGVQLVDVIDIATHSGASGQWVGNNGGTRTGTVLPANVCTNVEYNIARRYRGGKPRGFYWGGVAADLQDTSHWNTTFIDAVNTAVTAFFGEVTAFSVGAVGTLAHVNLSYYTGFTNHSGTSGRERAVPTYRATALHDNILSYSTKAVVGSQRKRRTSTTP
jgi:hypothetical protein